MGQRVLITAGASGIGREIARAFAAGGARVFVCDIDAKGLEALKREIPGVRTEIRDVSKREDIERMATAELAVFLASDAAESISGQRLPIDSDMQKAF